MPFGLLNAPSTFQSFINDILREFLDEFVSTYINDCLIYSDTLEEYEKYVYKVVEALMKAGLPIDVDKCEFCVLETKFLGLIVGKEGYKMDLAKVQALLE